MSLDGTSVLCYLRDDKTGHKVAVLYMSLLSLSDPFTKGVARGRYDRFR